MEIGLVLNSYEPGQFTLPSMGLIRYSCPHISGSHEMIPTKIWSVDVYKMLTEMQKKFLHDVMTSALNSTRMVPFGVTTHKMTSHLMDTSITFQKNIQVPQ